MPSARHLCRSFISCFHAQSHRTDQRYRAPGNSRAHQQLPLIHNTAPQVVINNAGYIVTGFFADSSIDAQIKNAETNAMSCIRITHHFLNKMLDAGVNGCIGFTSSPSGMIPCPSSVMYGCTKAFLQCIFVTI